MTKFTLIGSGLAGGMMAAFLGRRGHEVDLYERRADPHAGNFVGGRSINLALSSRGIHALEQLGIADEVMQHAIPMRGRMIHDNSGELHFTPYDSDPTKCINSIGRGALNMETIDAAKRYPNVRVHFNHRCTGVDIETPSAQMVNTETNENVQAAADAIIGVDGAFSAVRRAMQRRERFDYSQTYLAHGYKELTIPPAADGGWRMEKHALHIWPRKSFMMIALPNPDGSFTCTLFWEWEGPRSFAMTRSDDEVRRFFDEEFPDAVPLMPDLLEDFRANPTGSLVTIRCAPWHHRDKIALIGDAAHAVLPFYGQGMNAAFEDCVVLDECLAEFDDNRERAFADYFRRRKPNVDALADLAVQNFVEMRDKTASPAFRAKTKLDHALETLLPGTYLPLYTMVSFTRIPYADAARRARRQDAIVYAGAVLLAFAIAV
ncbi:MAG TPA: NAD(P)/FAD-dependent oxidoreductase, partial [Chthoniobacterales bacterium]|nr:NAD(P)/FAD-dependent oxidoreductase [Chthoniobacterales bacterium]